MLMPQSNKKVIIFLSFLFLSPVVNQVPKKSFNFLSFQSNASSTFFFNPKIKPYFLTIVGRRHPLTQTQNPHKRRNWEIYPTKNPKKINWEIYQQQMQAKGYDAVRVFWVCWVLDKFFANSWVLGLSLKLEKLDFLGIQV